MATDTSEMDEKELEEARNNANNTNNVRNAADVAVASGYAPAVAVGTAVKAADKVTGGKATEAAGKVMTKANKHAPMGKGIQNASNKLSESGVSDKIGQVARAKNQYGGGAGANKAGGANNAAGKNVPEALNKRQNPDTAPNKVGTGKTNDTNGGGGQNGSLPSSSEKEKNKEKSTSLESTKKDTDKNKNDDTENDGKTKTGFVGFIIKHIVLFIFILIVITLLSFLLIIVIVAVNVGIFSEYDDAFGMSQTLGEETGGVQYIAPSQEQQEFYDKINNVKTNFQAQGKSVDAMKIVAVYHVLKTHGADLEYKNVSEWTITSWANAMFKNNSYDEETFKNNLSNNIFPQYLNLTQRQYEELADEVFDYIKRYNNLIGKDLSSNVCGTLGSCTYDIKGFSYGGSNVSKSMTISNLKVRLMQCGSPFGNGSYTTPISDELIDFEKYAAGVAYAEVGDGAPIEQYKTQIVAARSFALSRPSSMGNSRGLKLEEENGQWVLQISSCVADQVHCDIDKGCHGTGGSQGGYVVSGDDSSAWYHKPALPEGHDIRKAAEETQGEVLVNSQGYIINTGYLNTEQNMWRSLADQGMDYKQILMKTYGSGGVRSSGASDIKKANCSGSGGSCSTSGEWSSWRQTDPQWSSIEMGGSGQNIGQIGCLVTSVSIQLARSGVDTSINPLNPGTFVEFLNNNGGFASGGNYVWASVSKAAPNFMFETSESVAGMSRDQKLNRIKELLDQKKYIVAEVKGNTGQHWVAITGVNGSTVEMVDPASDSTDLWGQYNWANTSLLNYYKVG